MTLRRQFVALIAGLLLLTCPRGDVFAQGLDEGPQVLTFYSEVDDTDQPYALYLPPDYDPSDEYPLVMSLHGAGSNHRLNLRRVFGESNRSGESDVEASRYFPDWEDVNYIVAAPYARGTMGYRNVAEEDVMDVLADVKRRFSIDDTRMYLTGLSMGGGGALWIGLTRPDLWAAIAPVCPAPPPGTDTYAPNALNVPVHFFQGGADPVVDPESVRAWSDRLDSLGTEVSYTEYPDVGHNSWENAYADGQIFDWFSGIRKDPHPDRVRFATSRYKYNEAYWVRLDGLTPGTEARIDAQFTGENRLEVTTEALDGFTLFLSEHPQVTLDDPVTLRVDEQTLQVAAADTLSFDRDGDTWAAASSDSPTLVKRPGLEGPMSEAFAGRHIYVYGTQDASSEEELQRREEQAVTAATWSVYRGSFWGRVKVFPRVVADTAVRESDLEASNLVLFGTRTSNRLIDRFGDRLPFRFEVSSDDYGLTYIFPTGNGDQYALVSSGRPWWELAPQGSGEALFGQQVPALQLQDRPDYMLFGGRDSVRVEGRFNRQWRLSDEDASTLQETGAVSIVGEIVRKQSATPEE